MQHAFPQDMEICDPKGRDCIESNSTESFNCSMTCEGIYADVQWVGNKIEEDDMKNEGEEAFESKLKGEVGEELNKFYKRLEKEIILIKGSGEEKGEGLDKEKYKMMIAEYRKFKSKNVICTISWIASSCTCKAMHCTV